MRFTRSLLSGGNFGRLHKQYGEYRFALAPSEQNPWKGFFQVAIINTFKQYVLNNLFFFVPPAVTTYLLYDWAKKANHRANRKNPKEFENDK